MSQKKIIIDKNMINSSGRNTVWATHLKLGRIGELKVKEGPYNFAQTISLPGYANFPGKLDETLLTSGEGGRGFKERDIVFLGRDLFFDPYVRNFALNINGQNPLVFGLITGATDEVAFVKPFLGILEAVDIGEAGGKEKVNEVTVFIHFRGPSIAMDETKGPRIDGTAPLVLTNASEPEEEHLIEPGSGRVTISSENLAMLAPAFLRVARSDIPVVESAEY